MREEGNGECKDPEAGAFLVSTLDIGSEVGSGQELSIDSEHVPPTPAYDLCCGI